MEMPSLTLTLMLRSGFLNFGMVWKCRGVNKEWDHVVRSWLMESSTVRIVQATFTSQDALRSVFATSWGQGKGRNVRELILGDIFVGAVYDEWERKEADELCFMDKRTKTIPLQLGVLPNFPNLTHLVVVSRSALTPNASLDAWQNPHPSDEELEKNPVQLGLMNLYELADHTPHLTNLWAVHHEIDARDGTLTDVWGPDATPRVISKLRAQCRKLETLGMLSSPGPRIVGELHRSLSVLPPDRRTAEANSLEISETYSIPILAALYANRWPALTCAHVSMSTGAAPFASGRSCVHLYSDDWDGAGLGELGDVLDYAWKRRDARAKTFRVDVSVRCFAARALNLTTDVDPLDVGHLIAEEETAMGLRVAQRVDDVTGGAIVLHLIPNPLRASASSLAHRAYQAAMEREVQDHVVWENEHFEAQDDDNGDWDNVVSDEEPALYRANPNHTAPEPEMGSGTIWEGDANVANVSQSESDEDDAM